MAVLAEEALMRCSSCNSGIRVDVRRAKLTERDGHAAVVLGVPMQECPMCGTRYLTDEVAERLMVISDDLLRRPEQVSSVHWDDAFSAA